MTRQSETPALLIIHAEDGWQVWMSLQDHNPLTDAFGFIIGLGDSRDAAVADAVASLEAVLERLQAPPGKVAERDA